MHNSRDLAGILVHLYSNKATGKKGLCYKAKQHTSRYQSQHINLVTLYAGLTATDCGKRIEACAEVIWTPDDSLDGESKNPSVLQSVAQRVCRTKSNLFWTDFESAA